MSIIDLYSKLKASPFNLIIDSLNNTCFCILKLVVGVRVMVFNAIFNNISAISLVSII
jgi:hypothetical protein